MKHCLYGSQHYVHLYKAAGDAGECHVAKTISQFAVGYQAPSVPIAVAEAAVN
jgi:hypothetical protein